MNDIIKDLEFILFCSYCGLSSIENIYTIRDGNLICHRCNMDLYIIKKK